MGNSLEELVLQAYRGWKRRRLGKQQPHPDEEDIASLLEGKLSSSREEEIRRHILACEDCAEAIGLGLSFELAPDNSLPPELADYAMDKLGIKSFSSLEIILKLKEKAIELIKASGDILIGQELVPAAILRSRKISELKDEVIILKDFKDIRLEAKVENKSGKYFNVNIKAKDRQSKAIIKDLRVTLFKGDVELESCLNDAGSVTFEHVLLGKYMIEVSDLEGNLASVFLEVRA